jgi:DNA-binding response OmpR family regulator
VGKRALLPSVLVVENDADVRHALREALGDEFIIFDTAGSTEALAISAVATVNLVLVDLNLSAAGGGDGRQFVERYRASGGQGKVVLFSAQPDLDRIARGMQVDGTLTKPFDVDDLLATIRRLTRS